jgi:sporulation integral membrane protein YtvI
MNITAKLPEKMSLVIDSKIDEFLLDLSLKGMSKFDLSILSAPISGAWSIVKGLPSFAISVVVTIISCFFMTSEYDSIRDMIFHFLPKEKGERLVKIKNVTTKGIGKLLKAYISIMLITFIEMFVGLSLLKLIGIYDGGYIAIISLVACIVDIIPVLGTGTVLIPWSLFYLLTGNIGLGIGLVILYIIITVLRQIIEPKFVAGQVGLPSIITIMAMFIGGRVLGVFGIIILPLTVIVIKLMYDEGIIGSTNSVVSVKEEECK